MVAGEYPKSSQRMIKKICYVRSLYVYYMVPMCCTTNTVFLRGGRRYFWHVTMSPALSGAASLASLTQCVDVGRVALEAEQPCAVENKTTVDNKVANDDSYKVRPKSRSRALSQPWYANDTAPYSPASRPSRPWPCKT